MIEALQSLEITPEGVALSIVALVFILVVWMVIHCLGSPKGMKTWKRDED